MPAIAAKSLSKRSSGVSVDTLSDADLHEKLRSTSNKLYSSPPPPPPPPRAPLSEAEGLTPRGDDRPVLEPLPEDATALQKFIR